MNAPLDTQYLAEMVKAYVPEASQLPWGKAVDLALERDVLAADALSESVESQLNLEAAAAAANVELDDFFQFHDELVIGNFTGYAN
jgi:hypothetical protein